MQKKTQQKNLLCRYQSLVCILPLAILVLVAITPSWQEGILLNITLESLFSAFGLTGIFASFNLWLLTKMQLALKLLLVTS